MIAAYILIQTDMGRSADVAAAAAKVAGVVAADDVLGLYDVIVRAEASDVDALGRMIAGDIQTIPGIESTLTCTVVRL